VSSKFHKKIRKKVRRSWWVKKPFSCATQTENRTNVKRKTETPNFRMFAANRNEKRKFDFLGRQTINVNRRLLFQQTCPFIHYHFLVHLYIKKRTLLHVIIIEYCSLEIVVFAEKQITGK
jgi:hypothetical protein